MAVWTLWAGQGRVWIGYPYDQMATTGFSRHQVFQMVIVQHLESTVDYPCFYHLFTPKEAVSVAFAFSYHMPVDKKNSFYSAWYLFSKNEYEPKVGNNQKFLLQFDAA